MKFLRDNRGGAAVEFGLAALPTMFLILGVIQTGFVIWTDNLLHVAVHTAARCGGVGSSTPPCVNTGAVSNDMETAAVAAFQPLSGATFTSPNPNCSSETIGVAGTYEVSFGYIINLTLSASACYPPVQ